MLVVVSVFAVAFWACLCLLLDKQVYCGEKTENENSFVRASHIARISNSIHKKRCEYLKLSYLTFNNLRRAAQKGLICLKV